MKKVLIGLLVASVGLNVYLFMQSIGDKPILKNETVIDKPIENRAEHIIENKVVEEQINDNLIIESENSDLKNKLALAEERVDELEKELERLKLAEKPKLATEAIVRNSPPTAEEIEEMKNGRENVKELFKSEAVDYEWASNKENLIRDQILSGDLAPIVNINSLKCKTSTCKLTVEPYSQEKDSGALMSVGMRTVFNLMDNKNLKDLNSSFNTNDDDGVVDIYFSKDPDLKL